MSSMGKAVIGPNLDNGNRQGGEVNEKPGEALYTAPRPALAVTLERPHL